MENFFATIGIMAIVVFILYLLKKINYVSYQKKQRLILDTEHNKTNDCVYEAAEAYAHNGTKEVVKQILLNCISFDEEMAEDIITSAKANEKEEAFNSFIESVNRELGREAFSLPEAKNTNKKYAGCIN
jgi:hypothetical protein